MCIGLAIAPILRDIFLSYVDRKGSEHLAGTAEHIFHCVDNYLVFVQKDNYNQNVINVLEVFRENACELKFTIELLRNKSLHFLDIKMPFKTGHVCWHYSPRAKMPQLSFASGNTKVIKRITALSCLDLRCSDNVSMSYVPAFRTRYTDLGQLGATPMFGTLFVENLLQ